MTPEELARLHMRAYDRLRPWTAQDFASLLETPHVYLCTRAHAFALGRAVAGEVELLTIATDPEHRRQGLARACLADFEAEAKTRNATRSFLEVDHENPAAISLYESVGYATIATRDAYYSLRDGTRANALIMAKTLTP